jgi:hypothetical protein
LVNRCIGSSRVGMALVCESSEDIGIDQNPHSPRPL